MEREPRIEERAAQPYVGIRGRVTTEAEFRAAVDRGFPELYGWLTQKGIEPRGVPFIRYVEVSVQGQPLEFELAAPTVDGIEASDPVLADELRAGRYATLLHVGPYTSAEVPDLDAARARLVEWARGRGIQLESWATPAGTGYGACVERYITDARREPDWSKWETELAYLVREA